MLVYPPLLQTLLKNRGITNPEEAERFLKPDYERDLYDPFLLPDMDKAVERILQAIEKKEKIVIYSDYDADGIPGGVILHDFLEKIGHENFANYIPHRHLEGFGLNAEAIEKFKEDKVKLIITVDCGIADVAEVKHAKKCGMDVIITDHHEPSFLPSSDEGGLRGVELPDCVAVVDAKRADSQYPFRELCGAGVAYKLIQGILFKKRFDLKEGAEKWFLDMVGIATLSDMVPLVGENRALAFYGLKVLRKSPRPGLMKLLRLLKIDQKSLTEDDIGFSISPRINAASRMGDPEDAFKLFIAKTDAEADLAARLLDQINSERKGVVAGLVKEVKKIMKKRYVDGLDHKVIVIGNPEWKPSLLGLVANSLVDDHNRPVFLWGRDGGNILKGSCRGDGSISVVALMNELEPGILEEFGGHDMSGGFSVIQEKIHLLEEKLQFAYERVMIKADLVSPKPRSGEVKAEAELTFDEVTLENYKLLEKLAPFGTGNPKPLFIFKKAVIQNIKTFGKENNHLELGFVNSRGQKIKAVGFFREPGELKVGDQINLFANLELSFFGQRSELRLRIVGMETVL